MPLSPEQIELITTFTHTHFFSNELNTEDLLKNRIKLIKMGFDYYIEDSKQPLLEKLKDSNIDLMAMLNQSQSGNEATTPEYVEAFIFSLIDKKIKYAAENLGLNAEACGWNHAKITIVRDDEIARIKEYLNASGRFLTSEQYKNEQEENRKEDESKKKKNESEQEHTLEKLKQIVSKPKYEDEDQEISFFNKSPIPTIAFDEKINFYPIPAITRYINRKTPENKSVMSNLEDKFQQFLKESRSTSRDGKW